MVALAIVLEFGIRGVNALPRLNAESLQVLNGPGFQGDDALQKAKEAFVTDLGAALPVARDKLVEASNRQRLAVRIFGGGLLSTLLVGCILIAEVI